MKTIGFGNDLLRLEILPECGGKIRSLFDLQTGKEWMWRNPCLPQRVPCYGESFVENLDTGGWDEIFPSVSPCGLGAMAVPDHGDLVSLPWEVAGTVDGVLSMEASARSMPVTLRREIVLADDRPEFRLEYALTNNSDEEQPFLVATHPLVALEPGSRMALPDDTLFRVAGSEGEAPLEDTIRAGTLNALMADAAGGWALKLFSVPGALSAVGFHHPDGTGIRLSWNAEDLPVLGLWVNHGGWTGTGGAPYRNVGIEPGNASCDSLAEAVAAGSAGRLAPGECRRWGIGVRLV